MEYGASLKMDDETSRWHGGDYKTARMDYALKQIVRGRETNDPVTVRFGMFNFFGELEAWMSEKEMDNIPQLFDEVIKLLNLSAEGKVKVDWTGQAYLLELKLRAVMKRSNLDVPTFQTQYSRGIIRKK